MDTSPFSTLFSSAGLFYTLFLPVMVIQFFALLAIPSVLRSGGRTVEIGKSLLSYGAQTVGIILMTIGGLPTIYTVLASQTLPAGTYAALLFIFAAGGITYLWHDAALSRIDALAKAVPQMIFACAWRFLGFLIVLCSLLSLVLRIALQSTHLVPGWWIMHITLFLYGMLLTLANIGHLPAGNGFASQAMAGTGGKRRKKEEGRS